MKQNDAFLIDLKIPGPTVPLSFKEAEIRPTGFSKDQILQNTKNGNYEEQKGQEISMVPYKVVQQQEN